MCVHPDDSIFLVDANDSVADDIKAQLSEHFKLKDLGDAIFAQYGRSKEKLHICQLKFIQRLIDKFGQELTFPSRNPNVFGQRLDELNEGDVVDRKRYRELIGSMLSIGMGRAYIFLCQYVTSEGAEPAGKAAIRVLRYLGDISKFGSCYCRNGANMINPVRYVDLNWGSDVISYRSTSDVSVISCGAPFVEAEYIALYIAVEWVLWLRHLLTELGVGNLPSTVINVDNQASITMTEHYGYQSRANHIDLRYHFVRDAV
ncbi:hypothetical protein PsorP6_006265 [Peronosclerospora sorghi]|uniref:Uncharacterized protein n=1 Tax=Peronosclerospora sorghi TaxID=230839 RepID=A0ACC0W0W9_9STRA|nr:hypothetical protein PsorP6_006265 [Peronosclerospora sorghi]